MMFHAFYQVRATVNMLSNREAHKIGVDRGHGCGHRGYGSHGGCVGGDDVFIVLVVFSVE